MVKRTTRLPKKEIHHVLRKGRAFQSGLFTIKYIKTHFKQARFSISCSLKVSKKAVVRNKIRRRLYELIRLHYNEISPGNYLIIVKPATLPISFPQLEQSFLHALQHINEVLTHKPH